MLVLSSQGRRELAQSWKPYLQTLKLCLFQNDYTPLPSSVVADFTEATFQGYTAVPLDDWSDAYINASGDGEVDENVRTFTATGGAVPNLVYGYFVVDGAGTLAYAERYDVGPVNFNANGVSFSVQPRLTCQNA